MAYFALANKAKSPMGAGFRLPLARKPLRCGYLL
jgi:hypothetical protein